MSDEVGKKTPLDASQYQMDLGSEGKVTMVLDCNRGRGNWQATFSDNSLSGQFRFGPMAMTKALCGPDNLEQFVAAQLGYIRSFVLEGDWLYLNLMADGGTLVWRRVVNNADKLTVSPTGGGPRNWQVVNIDTALNVRQQPSLHAAIIGQLKNGALLYNLNGCVAGEGMTWCDIQPLVGGVRGYVSLDYIQPAVAPNGAVVYGEDDSALRAGQREFDATGQVQCASTKAEEISQCAFGVARSGSGYATVVITKSDGRKRAVYFVLGQAIGASTSQADWGEFSATRDADVHIIQVGNERYEIPDAVVFGG